MDNDLWIRPYIAEIKDELYEKLMGFIQEKRRNEQMRNHQEIIKWYTYNNLMFWWMQITKGQQNLAEYLERYECRRVGIYGIGCMGKLCCDEILQSKEMEIPYIIDRSFKGNYKGISVISPENVDCQVDAIIITPVCEYLEIANVLCERTNAKLISLEDMIVILNEYSGQNYYGKCH